MPENDLRDLAQDAAAITSRSCSSSPRRRNLVSLLNMVNTQFRTATREENAENQSLVKALPALHRIIEQATDGLNRLGSPPSPGMNALFEGGAGSGAGACTSPLPKGRIYLVTAQAARRS